jgi:hypothetical protein
MLGVVNIGNASRAHLGGFTAAEVEAHLERVLASDAFKTSRRSQDFLRYVVQKALAGQEDSIKERTIAVEVFGRPADYDSSEDSFVRVKASEVRRRLASYAESRPEGDTLRIELPVGSYVPRFAPVAPAPSIAFSPRVPRRMWRFALAAGLAGVLVTGWVAVQLWKRSPLERFWTPVMESPEPLLIFIPTPQSYAIVGESVAARQPDRAREIKSSSGERLFVVPGVDKVGMGAAQGAMRFAALCARTGKHYTVKVGQDFSFSDLRNQPSVLFGAFSSKWTVEMNNDFRFRLVQQAGSSRIVDGKQPGREWLPVQGNAPGRPIEDFAIAGRVFDSKSGQLVLIAAGIFTFGTQAAAEFLTDEHHLAELARRAPQPLDRGNFQVLLHTKVIGNTPSPPKIVDTHFW